MPFTKAEQNNFSGNKENSHYEQNLVSDKRSRSETPSKMSATAVLYRAHQKLQQRRKLSPSKIREKHQMRQVLHIFILMHTRKKPKSCVHKSSLARRVYTIKCGFASA